MYHDHMTTCPVNELGDGLRLRDARGTHAASHPTDPPARAPILFHAF